MRTLLAGSASARQRAMQAARIEALAAADARLRPGTAMGQVFDAQAEVLGMGAIG